MISNNTNTNTGILIRFDDIAPNMSWEMMDKCQELLNYYDLKPVMGVIPDNQDNEILKYPKRENFWETVKKWELNNWSIAMHGYNHLYDKETNKKDFFNYGGRSEFFGHSYEDQLSKIKKGLEIFEKNNIQIDTFFAPNHTYDRNTFKALKNSGILKIIDGYGLMPYSFNGIKFVPQLFYKLYLLPFGIQSTQIHINYWSDKDFINFKKFIEKHHKKVISADFAFSKISNSNLYKIINSTFEKLMKLKRLVF
jgi:predicted deacetylase